MKDLLVVLVENIFNTCKNNLSILRVSGSVLWCRVVTVRLFFDVKILADVSLSQECLESGAIVDRSQEWE